MGKNIIERIFNEKGFLINLHKEGIKIKETTPLEKDMFGMKLDINGFEMKAIYVGSYFEYIFLIDLICDISSDRKCIFLH